MAASAPVFTVVLDDGNAPLTRTVAARPTPTPAATATNAFLIRSSDPPGLRRRRRGLRRLPTLPLRCGFDRRFFLPKKAAALLGLRRFLDLPFRLRFLATVVPRVKKPGFSTGIRIAPTSRNLRASPCTLHVHSCTMHGARPERTAPQ